MSNGGLAKQKTAALCKTRKKKFETSYFVSELISMSLYVVAD